MLTAQPCPSRLAASAGDELPVTLTPAGGSRFWKQAARILRVVLLVFGVGSASAATISVTTTGIVVDAAGSAAAVTLASLPGPDGQVSLREAVAAANSNPGADLITFAVNGVFGLSGALDEDENAGGDLDVKQSLSIEGNGVGNTIFDASGGERFFDVYPSQAILFQLSNLTVQHGDTRSRNFNEGGAIYLNTNVTSTFTDCRIVNNQAGAKGAICNLGSLTMTRCVLSGNFCLPIAGAGNGGALWTSGALTMTDCTVQNNIVSGSGGGIRVELNTSVTVDIRNTTFSANRAVIGAGTGGAISAFGGQGNLKFTNCTFSGNSATQSGGACAAGSGNMTFSNVTMTENFIDGPTTASAAGGLQIGVGTVTLLNTIVAGNNHSSSGEDSKDIYGNVAAGSFNLIGDGTGSNLIHGTNGNQVGNASQRIDPLLGPLQNNGGSTTTKMPLVGSPALDHGKTPVGITTDQRGLTRPYDQVGFANAVGGDGSDIGAVEQRDIVRPSLTVARIAGNAYPGTQAGEGNTITLFFTASETIQTPTVFIATVAASVTSVDGKNWFATIPVTAGISEGTVSFSIDFLDLAGNAGTTVHATTNGSSVQVDRTTETPTLTSPTLLSTMSHLVSVTFTLPEMAMYGTVKLIFKDFSGSTIRSTLVLSDVEAYPGERTLTFDPANPVETGSNYHILSGAALVDGNYRLELSYQDLFGNPAATASIALVTIDRGAPTLTVPDPITREATSPSGAAITFTPTAVDVFDRAPVVTTTGGQSGDTFTVGLHSVDVTAADGAGNQTTATFTITVVDTTPPAASVPASYLLSAQADGTDTLGDLTAEVTASDLVGVASIVQTPAVGTVLAAGVHPVSFKVSDAAGNFVTVLTTVWVRFDRGTEPETTVAAESGSPAPGAGLNGLPADAVLGTFGAPAVSGTRRLATRVTLLSGKTKLVGIYTVEVTGMDALPAFQGGAVPGADGVELTGLTFKAFLDPVIAPNGRIAFSATAAGANSAQDQGVWTDAFGPLALVLREGSDVAGLPAGAKLKSVTTISLQDAALVALVKLTAAKDVVTAGKDDVALVCLDGVNSGTVLLRTGALLNGSAIKTIATLAPALGSPGQGRWHGTEAVLAKVTLASKEVQLVQVPIAGGPVKVLSTLDAASAVHADARWKSFAVPAMGGSGLDLVTSATLAPKPDVVTALDDVVLVHGSIEGGLEMVAREGGVTPLSADPVQVRYATFFDPVINDAGQVAFLATVQGKAVKAGDKTVLVAGLPGSQAVVARLGGFAPKVDGTDSTAKWSKFVSLALPDGEDSGVVLLAETTGGDTPTKGKLGLWVTDSAGDLRQLARVGLPLEDGGSLVAGLTLLNSVAGAYGTPRSYNGGDSVAALVTFADKSQALIRFDVP